MFGQHKHDDNSLTVHNATWNHGKHDHHYIPILNEIPFDQQCILAVVAWEHRSVATYYKNNEVAITPEVTRQYRNF
jgi:hypothetical protein